MSINLQTNGGAKVEVSDQVFDAEYNEALIHQVVVAYQAGARAGTKAQKNRSAVSGGGAKPWRQKGTGRARAGTIRSPIFRGGGLAFPASPRNFSQKVNKKMYRAAMRSIFSELNRQERLVVIDGFDMKEPKTKLFKQQLADMGLNNALIALGSWDDNVALSARNLKDFGVLEASELNPLDLLSFEKVVLTKDAVEKVEEALK